MKSLAIVSMGRYWPTYKRAGPVKADAIKDARQFDYTPLVLCISKRASPSQRNRPGQNNLSSRVSPRGCTVQTLDMVTVGGRPGMCPDDTRTYALENRKRRLGFRKVDCSLTCIISWCADYQHPPRQRARHCHNPSVASLWIVNARILDILADRR